MPGKTKKAKSEVELPTEVIVDTAWAEEMYAKGRLPLSPEQVDQLTAGPTMRLPADLMNAYSPPIKRSAPIEWIEPMDAVHLLAPMVGGDVAAKLAIAERLRDGAIDCSSVWMSEGPDIGPISNHRPKFPVIRPGLTVGPWVSRIRPGARPSMIGRAFWTNSDDWDADLQRWDWKAGLFVVSRQLTTVVEVNGVPTKEFISKSRTRMVASGIQFSREDIIKIAAEDSHLAHGQSQVRSASQAETPTPKSRRGRKKSDPWAVWFAEVLVFAMAKGIDTNQDAASFHEHINEMIFDRDPGEKYLEFDTVEKTIGVIMNRLIEAKSKRVI